MFPKQDLIPSNDSVFDRCGTVVTPRNGNAKTSGDTPRLNEAFLLVDVNEIASV